MSRLEQIEKEISDESALGLLLAPYRTLEEVDRRMLTVNGREIVEQELSDGTFRVRIDGMFTNMDYARAIRWAGGMR